jgi:hypothetical protein
MNALEEKLLQLAIGFVGFLLLGGSVIGWRVIKYLSVLADTKIEEAEAKRAEARAASTKRLATIGELAAASAEEATRGTSMKGEDKAQLAQCIARDLLEAPPAVASESLVQTAVQAGVSKLRGSLASSTTYSFTGEQLAEVVRAASARPPPAELPVYDHRKAQAKTFPRPPRLPGEGGTK